MSQHRALDTYRMWHQKPAKEIVEIPLVLPRRLSRLGSANRIVYESDKWETDGEFYPYQHEFTSSPDVFVADNGGDIDTRDFLEIEDLDDFEVNWIHLGTVNEFRFRVPGRSKRTNMKYGEPPLMCCTPEKDTLVILASELLFVRGGTMEISERGIVR